MSVKIKRGTKANLPTLLQGEQALTTDTLEFFIGLGSSNLQIPTLVGNTIQNANLNTITKNGIYMIYGTSCTNLPSELSSASQENSVLKVVCLNNYSISQELTTTNNVAYSAYANIKFSRVSINNGTSWSTWKKIICDTDLQGDMAYKYQKLPSGLIIQWGNYGATGVSNFGITFPKECMSVIVSSQTSTPSYCTSFNSSSYTVAGGGTGNYIAIGH